MLVTLTTDFGTSSPYLAAMKGALLSVDPAAQIIDLSHAIAPQNVRQAAYFLAQSAPFFPTGTLHVCVVDPGVGSERALLYSEAGGQRFLAPDNGCLSEALRALGGPKVVRRLTEVRFWREAVSATFHGRDVLAPVAGHLTKGLSPTELGPVVTEFVRLELPVPAQSAARVEGEVIFIDGFGNLITNVPTTMLPATFRVSVAGQTIPRVVRTYAEGHLGELVALHSSSGHLEVALVNGNAADRLRATCGAAVIVTATN
jgi:S-adenosylmethionine hydrolase